MNMTTLLYIHGLESGPRGAKTEALEAAGFTVVSEQMPCPPIRDLKGPEGAQLFEQSLMIQLQALATHKIDAIVGSSFGGAVAVELLLRGLWAGPTLLLCPGHELMAERTGYQLHWEGLEGLPGEVTKQVLVVHGRGDAVVPVGHSQNLVAGSQATLVLVDDDHRLSATSNTQQLTSLLALIGVSP